MLASNIVLPPSPNWYGSQLAAVQPQTHQAAYAGHSQVVVVCCSTQTVLRTMCAGPARVTAVCWCPSAVTPYQLVAGHEDGSLRTWDARSGSCVRSHKKKGAEISALALQDRQPAVAVVGDVKGNLQLWQYQSGNKPQPLSVALRGKITQLVTLPIGASSTTAAAPSAQEQALAQAPPTAPGLVLAACSDGSVTLVDVDSGSALLCFSAHRGCVHAMSACLAPVGVLPNTSIIVTASGEEGTAKVWQLSTGGRQPSAGLLATLPALGMRPEAGGGRHGHKNQRMQPQWLSTTLLPVPPPTASLEPATDTLRSAATGSQEDHCWVAVGLPTGEIQLFKVHTVTGRYELAHKVYGVHNRPIFSMLPLPVATPETLPTSRASAPHTSDAAAAPAPAPAPAPVPAPAPGVDTGSHSPATEAGAQGDAETPGAGSAGMSGNTGRGALGREQEPQQQEIGTTVPPLSEGAVTSVSSSAGGSRLSQHHVSLVTISQDRLLAVTLVRMRLGPAQATANRSTGKGAGNKKIMGKDAVGQSAVGGEAAGLGAGATEVSTGSTAAAAALLQPVPRTAGAPGAVTEAIPAADRASAPLPPQAAPAAATEEDGAGQASRHKAMPVFRVAKGPPADKSIRGFGGRGGSPAVQIVEPTHAAAAPGTSTAQPATTKPTTLAPSIPTPVAVGALASTSDTSATAASTTGDALTWTVARYESVWKLPGLGGYSHGVDVAGLGVAVAADTAADGVQGALRVDSQWEVVTGSGDRTVRTSRVQWPVTCTPPRIRKAPATEAASNDTQGAAEGVGAGDEQQGTAGGEAWQCESDKPSVTQSVMLWKNLNDQVLCVARHPLSARYVAFGCQDGQVGIFDTQTQSPHFFNTRHQGPVLQVCWYSPAPHATPAPSRAARQPGASPPPADTNGDTSPADDPAAAAAALPPPPPSELLPPSPEPPQDPSAQEAGAETSTDADLSARVSAPTTPPVSEPSSAPASPKASDQGKAKRSKAGKGTQANKDNPTAQLHAVCQSWQLLTCGAEGRLLTWQMPALHDWAKDSQPAAAHSHAARGQADRSGRWGAAAPTTASLSNDMVPQLLAMLPTPSHLASSVANPNLAPPPSGAGTPAGVAAMAVVSNPTGDLLVVALTNGQLAVLGAAGHSAMSSASAPAAVIPATLLASCQVAGAPPTLLAAGLTGHTVSVACGSSRGPVAVYQLLLPSPPAAPEAGTGQRVSPSTHSAQQPAQSTSDAYVAGGGTLQPLVLQDGDSSSPAKTATAVCWLPGQECLAVACAEDNTIQIWAAAQVSPATSTTAATAQLSDGLQSMVAAEVDVDGLVRTAMAVGAQPVVLATLRGHTDHVACMVSRALTGGPKAAAGLVWLFSGSRDQSTRSWLLDPAALWQQHRQLRLQRLEQMKQQAAEAATAATATEQLEPDQELTAAAASSGEQPGGGDRTDRVVDALPAADQATGHGPNAARGGVQGVQGDGQVEVFVPAYLAAAPGKSDITGVPGGRPKTAKKPMVLGAKQILDNDTAALVQSATQAWQQLQRVLGGLQEPALVAADTPAPSQSVYSAVGGLGDPAAMVAAGVLPKAPEKQILVHLWAGDVKAALQVALEHNLLSGDLVSVTASLGRTTWAAASRLYAAQQEAAGQVHVAAMHLVAIGDRQAAAAAYRRAGLLMEAQAVDGVPSLIAATGAPV